MLVLYPPSSVSEQQPCIGSGGKVPLGLVQGGATISACPRCKRDDATGLSARRIAQVERLGPEEDEAPRKLSRRSQRRTSTQIQRAENT